MALRNRGGQTPPMRIGKQILVIAGLLMPGPAWAWGSEGHEVVAHLAALNLTPKARAEVSALLGGGDAEASMAITSNWADEIRDLRPDTSSWHFVDIEIDGDLHYDAARDCPGGNCVVAQIQRDEAILESQAPDGAKAAALRLLIHFVGDIFQPLHAADNHDRGGNMVRVPLGGRRAESLHHVWDDDVVAALGYDPAAIARGIDAETSPVQKTALMSPASPTAWAEASARMARDVVYPQAARMDQRTVQADAPLARQQLAKAGYALAGILNRAFK